MDKIILKKSKQQQRPRDQKAVSQMRGVSANGPNWKVQVTYQGKNLYLCTLKDFH